MRPLAAALCAALLLVAAPAAAQSPVVATVEGAGEVTEAQYEHWQRIARNAAPKRSAAATRRVVMQLLLQNLWITGEADERGIVVTDEAVDREFREQKRKSFRTEREFRRFLRDSGYTVADIKYRIRLEQYSNRIRRQVMRAVAKPTEEELRAYYDGNRREFVLPERRDIRYAIARTRAGAVAKRKRLRRVTRDDVPAVVFRRRRGVVRRNGLWLAFRVVRVHPRRTQSFEQARPVIRALLVSEREQAALDDFIEDFETRWRGRTECREVYATRDCGRRIP